MNESNGWREPVSYTHLDVYKRQSTDTKYVRKEKTSPDEKDSYVELPGRVEYEYAQNMLFPRM